MIRRWLWAAGWCALLTVSAGPRAAANGPKPLGPPDAVRDADSLARWVDEQFAADWQANKLKPAPDADDAEFLRRASLDLAGRIPTVAEAREFLADTRPDKRRRLVERLLTGPRYASHFTNVWRSLMLPEADATIQARAVTPAFESWLRKELTNNTGYDAMVRELLTVPLMYAGRPRLAVASDEGGASAFYLAKDLKPENIAGATARLFLGVKIECAQCHNHPFGDWKREQFWGYAAFFAGIERPQQQGDVVLAGREDASNHALSIPGTDKVVQAAFLDGTKPDWKAAPNPRQALADWMTAADNPYFARAAVNRMWYTLFGAGLTDPVDEMVGGQGAASHPDVLDELARQFIDHKFDLKYLITALVLTREYQLSSARTDPGQDDARRFARMPLRALTPEQLFDSVAEAVYYPRGGDDPNPYGVFVLNGPATPRDEFRTKFAHGTDRPTEAQTSILQALTLMNGKLVGDATSLERSELLTAVCESPFMDTRERIETLYLATLTRKPKPKELERLTHYVEDGGAYADARPFSAQAKDKIYKQALADVFWALLNSGEFYLNH